MFSGIVRLSAFAGTLENRICSQQLEDTWHSLFVEALQQQSYIEYLLDILLTGSIVERAALVAEHGKEVRKIEQRISEFAARHSAGCDEERRCLVA